MSLRHCIVVVSLLGLVATPAVCNDNSAGTSSSEAKTSVAANTDAAAFNASATRTPRLVGSYPADGTFRTAYSGAQYLELLSDVSPGATRPSAVPPWVDLGCPESVIEDYAPPARATKTYRKRAPFAHFRDALVAKIYGPERILIAPTHVVTDSKQRLILLDSATPSIHVLDGANSFRIMGGPQHRMLHPTGIAVDGQDNIYVADAGRALVLVYDGQGRFVREIGRAYGESQFERPTDIAVDRRSNRLFVLDGPYSQMVVFEASGRVIKRVGGHRDFPADVRLEHPTAVAAGANRVAVLDSAGTRVVILDQQFNLVSQFAIASVNRNYTVGEIGLALDNAGNVYVSRGSSVQIFSETGKKVGVLGNEQQSPMMFSGVSGVWIDAADRMYVADTNHRRVQVFEMK